MNSPYVGKNKTSTPKYLWKVASQHSQSYADRVSANIEQGSLTTQNQTFYLTPCTQGALFAGSGVNNPSR